MNVEDRQLVFHFQNSASGHCLDSTGSGLPISDIREPVTIYMAIEDLRLKHIPDQSGFDSAQPASVESWGFDGELSRVAESKLFLRIFIFEPVP